MNYKSNNYLVLVDRRYLTYYRSTMSNVSTFWTMSDWEWNNSFGFKELRAFGYSMYIGVI